MTQLIAKILSTCLAILYTFPPNGNALDIMLPQVYRDNIPVVGWMMSEKLDGVRGYWDGKQLFSKNGLLFHPPAAFICGLPPFPLEGELWGGRKTFEKTVSTVKKQRPHNGWFNLQFAIFDVPKTQGRFSSRIQKAEQWFSTHLSQYAFVIPQQIITRPEQLQTELQRIEKLGGEGLIVRNPDALYITGRSSDILKVKNFFDMEAVVIAHIPGRGKNQGRLGSLLVEISGKNGEQIQFKIGTGFSTLNRQHPPPIGSVVTFKYYGFYPSGIPKFPSFLRVRSDLQSMVKA